MRQRGAKVAGRSMFKDVPRLRKTGEADKAWKISEETFPPDRKISKWSEVTPNASQEPGWLHTN